MRASWLFWKSFPTTVVIRPSLEQTIRCETIDGRGKTERSRVSLLSTNILPVYPITPWRCRDVTSESVASSRHCWLACCCTTQHQVSGAKQQRVACTYCWLNGTILWGSVVWHARCQPVDQYKWNALSRHWRRRCMTSTFVLHVSPSDEEQKSYITGML